MAWRDGRIRRRAGGTFALASLPNFILPGDISASKRYYKEDIVDPPFEVAADGTMAVPTKPGIGVEILIERLERVTARREEFKP